MKITTLNSGNHFLDSECYDITRACIYSYSKMDSLKAVADIRTFLNKYPNHRELIIERLKFNLSEFIDEKQEKIKNGDKESNVGIRKLIITTNSIQHLLNWLNNGLGGYSEKETSQHNKPVSKANIKEASEYNTNDFNNDCFLLFEYLIQHYEKEGIVKYINIYYFLKQIAKDEKDRYRFSMKIEKEYKPFIKRKYHVTIKKFAKAEYAYPEIELPILKDLEKKFSKTIELN